MILNNQQKTEIKKHIYSIDKMDKQELHKFAQEWYLAKEDLDSTVFKWVQRAIDLKEAELQEIGDVSVMVVMSEMGEGDLK